MDPNGNLKEQLELARKLLTTCQNIKTGASWITPSHSEIARLAELVLALNEWLANGHSLPQIWITE